LTQHYLGPKKSLAIIRVAGESILIGVTDTNINMIKSLALLDDEVPEEIHSNNFADLFGGVPSTSAKATADSESADADPEEEFSIRGVKDVVSKKLKGMRSFQ
jgi:flagellar protein FliO/FliZ